MVEKSSKEFLAHMDAFCVFVVQQGEPQHKTKRQPS